MKTLIITGAASGVGYAIAKTFSTENLILIDKDSKKIKSVAKELGCEYYVCDISKIEQLNQSINQILSLHNQIDILINCAGLWTKGELTKQDDGHFADINSFERIKHIIDTNTYGTIAIIKSVVPMMKKQGYRQIININSQSGMMVKEFCPVYNASKHGSRAFTRAILTDLVNSNIRLTDVCPGLIKTDFYINANDESPQSIIENGLEPQDVANTVKYIIDLPKHITIPTIEIKHIKNY